MKTLTFLFEKTDSALAGELFYVANDYALDFTAHSSDQQRVLVGRGGFTSIAFDTLQFVVGIETKALVYPFGYFPKSSWIKTSLPTIDSIKGAIYLMDTEKLLPDVSLCFDIPLNWVRLYDEKTGWLLFGVPPSGTPDEELYVEFAESCILCLKDHKIQSIWLKPHLGCK
jgi:hypothetical protein